MNSGVRMAFFPFYIGLPFTSISAGSKPSHFDNPFITHDSGSKLSSKFQQVVADFREHFDVVLVDFDCSHDSLSFPAKIAGSFPKRIIPIWCILIC